MQKKRLFIFALTLFIATNLSLVPALAKTNSASESAITDNLKKRIQATIEQAKENLITEKPQPLAYVGQVKDIIQHVIQIHTPQDNLKYAQIEDPTLIIRNPANKQIKLNDVRLDDGIIAIGYPKTNEPDTLEAKRVIVSQNLTFKLNKITGIAKINRISKNYLQLKPLDQSQTKKLRFDRHTIIKNKSEILKSNDFQVGQTIIYTANLTKTDPQATIIMIVL